MPTINEVKVADLIGLGYFTVTFAKMQKNKTFGKDEIRLIVKLGEDSYGITTSAKHIMTNAPNLVGKVCKFKGYTKPNENGEVWNTYCIFEKDN